MSDKKPLGLGIETDILECQELIEEMTSGEISPVFKGVGIEDKWDQIVERLTLFISEAEKLVEIMREVETITDEAVLLGASALKNLESAEN